MSTQCAPRGGRTRALFCAMLRHTARRCCTVAVAAAPAADGVRGFRELEAVCSGWAASRETRALRQLRVQALSEAVYMNLEDMQANANLASARMQKSENRKAARHEFQVFNEFCNRLPPDQRELPVGVRYQLFQDMTPEQRLDVEAALNRERINKELDKASTRMHVAGGVDVGDDGGEEEEEWDF